MIKSFFTKYMLMILAIILVSFVLMTLVSVTVLNRQNQTLQRKSIQRIGDAVADCISHCFVKYTEENGNEDVSLNDFIQDSVENDRVETLRFITSIARCDKEILIFITDKDGNFIMSDEVSAEKKFINTQIPVPKSLIEKTNNPTEKYYDDLDGILKGKRLVYSAKVSLDNETLGYVFICYSMAVSNEFFQEMLQTMLVTYALVIVASLIACYFMNDKFSAPLRQISKAAKEFGEGKYDVRVDVIGNDEVANLAAAFNEMARSISESEEKTRSFLANVSHDLKTPMTTIQGFVDGILDGTIPKEKQEYYLKIISSEVRRLSRLVTSLLDISKIQAGQRKFNMISFDVCELTREIIISLEDRIEKKELDVEIDFDSSNMFVIADRDAIHQVMYNICDNAIKFASFGGKFRVRIYEKDNLVFVAVMNEGMGIALNDLPYVFDKFYKADTSRGLDRQGTGLGLFIAKTIMEAHNQKIYVDSVEGKWVEFTFTLKKDNKPKLDKKEKQQ